MTFWIILWKIVLIVGVVSFAGMAVWVSIGGVFDIKRLFQRIEKQHQSEADHQTDSPAKK